jgi:monoamine oxidase
VLLLEARGRIGGRCWTRHAAGLSIPVELGAEFIHGEAAVTHALLGRAGIAAIDSNREQRYLDKGRLRALNAFSEAQRAVRRGRLARDVSFESFLARQPVSQKTKTFARMMVEGFDAADPKRVSARSIIDEWGEGGELGASQPRPRGGYGALLGWLANSAVRAGVRLQLDSPLRELRWKCGAVKVRGMFLGRSFLARARRAVVTLPLGVLHADDVRFVPSLREKEAALRSLAAGPVIRVALGFDAEFWRERAPDVAFFHVPGAAFPTFWTPLPMRAPLLTAWAGGPKAARLTGSSPAHLVRAALASVQAVFGKGIEARLAWAHAQDWAADPYARSGYSYVLVGGEGAREWLARPIGETLFFAGEATDSEEAGTVAGALRSGKRAAREALRSF